MNAPRQFAPQTPSLVELQRDVAFLKGYLGLPVKLRRIAAEHWTEVFRTSTDDLLRKTAFVKVYEDVIASSEDLGMFYFALKHLGASPAGVLRYCDRFQVQDYEKEWNDTLAALPPDGHFLEGHLPSHGAPDPSDVNRAEVDRLFRKLTEVLKRGAKTRVVAERQLVRSGNKIKHGLLIHDAGDAIVVDATNPAETGLPVTLEFLENLTSAVVSMRQATSVIVSALIHKMHFAFACGAYGLTRAESTVLLESFKEIPRTF